jgi:tRNA-specific 2-thiouridylase
VPVVVEPSGRRIVVEFRTPQRAVAPGQSVVLYRDDEVLGGGRIIRAIAA